MSDSLLGTSYISLADFKARAASFGANEAIASRTDAEIEAMLASATLLVDAFCGRSFLPDAISEQQRFDFNNRRIRVNQPPVMELVSFQIRIAPGLVSTFNVADVIIQNQEKYLELASFALGTNLTTPLLSMGITEPFAEVVYRSYQTVPRNVAAATGFVAAELANTTAANETLAPGLSAIEVTGLKVRREASGKTNSQQGNDRPKLPSMAEMLLATMNRITIA